ncbi:sulfotransferase [Streptomyces shenzhenensis]|uniref:sulfotransferase n=1 Tax=Streptomyces shenzhenensis TaxID=943815 RepID=UPI0015F07D54|nr:sulfotransferase [Streptomyces shenzhenensis]
MRNRQPHPAATEAGNGPYDPVLAVARRRLDALSAVRAPVEGFRTAVKDLVVIASPFRGGTTLLTELLRGAPDLLHFQAEMQPLLRLAGWTYPDNGADSERIAGLTGDVAFLERELGSDVGNPVNGGDGIDWPRYAQDVLWRWIVQWPMLPLTLAEVEDMLEKALGDQTAGGPDRGGDPTRAVSLALLKMLATRYREVNPYYADVSAAEIAGILPDLPRPQGPHGDTVIEFAPLAVPKPWRRATRQDVRSRTVITKTPVNVYKMDALRAFFPEARIRVIHLTRNPGAAISSYREAWLSPWFFNAPAGIPLDIGGYTEPGRPWSRDWWKLDFPPGWQDLTRSTLEEVCAAQWCASHTAIFEFLAEHQDIDVLRLTYEDLIGTQSERTRAIDDLAEWLGTDRSHFLEPAVRGMTPMNSITLPKRAKWHRDYDVLRPVLGGEAVMSLAAEMGYSPDMTNWP